MERKILKDILFGVVMLATIFIVIGMYVLLHESAHAIAVIAFGGTVERFVYFFVGGWVYYSGLDYVSSAVMGFIIVIGEVFPLIIFLIVFIFYRHDKKFFATDLQKTEELWEERKIDSNRKTFEYLRATYHFFFFIFAAVFVLPLFGWVFLFWQSQDPIKFIQTTNIHPLIVAFSYLAIIAVVFFYVLKKKLIHAVVGVFRERWMPKKLIIQQNETENIEVEIDNATDKNIGVLKKRRLLTKIIAISLAFVLTLSGIFIAYSTNRNFANFRPIPSVVHRGSIGDVREFYSPWTQPHHMDRRVSFVLSPARAGTFVFTLNVTGGDFITHVRVVSLWGEEQIVFLNSAGRSIFFSMDVDIAQSDGIHVFMQFFASFTELEHHIQIWENSQWTDRANWFPVDDISSLRPIFGSATNFATTYYISLRER
ncbi:MAG: hypothetical protein FWC11_04995 [Firmicutes bacterium]|nr:hypothetical protein [Bacillota bacterium]MCL2256200.1 hypothetical protein [Bacillota bacterium]